MNTKTLKTRLIEKINTLSGEQLKLIADLINQFDESSNSEIMTTEESQAMKKWEYLIQHNQEIDKANPLSNEEINMIRKILRLQNKTIPLDLPKDDFFIADDFNDPLPDEIIDLFY